MLEFDIFNGSVLVDDVELPQYNVVTDDSTQTVTCWIPSQVNKAFAVRGTTLSYPKDIAGYVKVDGVHVRAHILRKNQGHVFAISHARTSSTTQKQLMFSPLELTDDDSFLHSGDAKDLGDITLEFWTISTGQPRNSECKPINLDTKVHELAKKGMQHRIGLGKETAAMRSKTCSCTKISRLVTFIFKYRSIDMLRADGLAPPVPRTKSGVDKRKARAEEEGDNENSIDGGGGADDDDDDGDDEKAEAELKALLNRANQIQSRLARKANKPKPKKRKRVKTEDHPGFICGEVIDLT